MKSIYNHNSPRSTVQVPRPFVSPTAGEVRGPFTGSPGAPPRLYFYVYGGENGWLIVDRLPGETESQCRARAIARGAEVKEAAV